MSARRQPADQADVPPAPFPAVAAKAKDLAAAAREANGDSPFSVGLVVDDGWLCLSWATAQNAVRVRVAPTAVTAGAVSVDPTRLARLASNVTGDVTIAPDDQGVSITAGRFRGRIPYLETVVVGPDAVTGTALVLPPGWRDVAAARSHDECRPILTGLGVSDRAVVATDSYRLHAVLWPEAFWSPPAKVTESASATLTLPAIVWAHRDDPTVVLSKQGCTTTDATATRQAPAEGVFPNWMDLTKSWFTGPALFEGVDLAAMAAACRRLARLGRVWTHPDQSHHVTATPVDAGTFELSTDDRNGGVMTETLDGVLRESIGFQGRYMADMLAGATSANLYGGEDKIRPIVLRENLEGGARRLRGVMPVRLFGDRS